MKNVNCEIYKTIKEYPDYKICSNGDVISLKKKIPKILKQHKDGGGYFFVNLSKNGKAKSVKIHKLLAVYFMGYVPNNRAIVIDHIDNNKGNNNLSNLQIITNRENSSKDRDGGSSKYVGVSKCKQTGNWVSMIRIGKKHKNLGRFKTEIEAHNAYQKELKIITDGIND